MIGSGEDNGVEDIIVDSKFEEDRCGERSFEKKKLIFGCFFRP